MPASFCAYRSVFILFLIMLLCPAEARTAATPPVYSLSQCLERARQNHPQIKLQQFRIRQAQALCQAAKTEFLPRLDAGYSFLYRDRINAYDISGYSFPANTHDVYNLNLTLTQPLFTGFSLIENFRLRRLGIKQAQAEEELAHLEITYATTSAYFNHLKQLKFAETADHTVARLEAQARDAQLFYDHELIP
ncbi:MAG: TolC family protein, partial [Deltaproteobacteria bacterium]|nr:TolC family protein [Deltaproteobacteria bacterium]